MVPFSGMITHDGTITFTHTNGRLYTVLPTNVVYKAVKEKLREVSRDPENEFLRLDLYDLSQPRNILHSSTGGRVRVENNQVLFDGIPVKNFIAERIIWMLGEGFDASPMLAFFENVKLNPSKRAVDELYRFMETNRMGITPDGMILAYKRVSDDYLDLYTGKMDNSVGKTVSMARNEVNDDPMQLCKEGLHVCAMSYLPHYGVKKGNRVVICRIHPRDVVSVPIDYANAKMRVCEYDVIDEITDDLDDILGSHSVYGGEPSVDDDDDDDDDEDEIWANWNDPLDEEDEEVEYHQPPVVPYEGAVYDFTTTFEYTRRIVSAVLHDILGDIEITDQSTIRGLGLDTFDTISIAINLETAFELEQDAIGEREITATTTVEQIVALIMSKS